MWWPSISQNAHYCFDQIINVVFVSYVVLPPDQSCRTKSGSMSGWHLNVCPALAEHWVNMSAEMTFSASSTNLLCGYNYLNIIHIKLWVTGPVFLNPDLRHEIGRDGHLDQSQAWDLGQQWIREYRHAQYNTWNKCCHRVTFIPCWATVCYAAPALYHM